MPDRDWDRELAEIDRRLAGVPVAAPPSGARSTSAPLPPANAGLTPAAAASDPARRIGSPSPGRRSWRTQFALLFRLTVALAVVAGLLAWPYGTRCGVGLAGYLLLVGLLGLAGLATSVAAWRHRSAAVHVVGLLLIGAAGVLAARDVLPRVGYAVPTLERPATWVCAG